MTDRKNFLVSEIVKYCQRMDRQGFVANHDGNISVRYDNNTLLCTPTAEAKFSINSDLIIKVDMQGRKVEGLGKPFSEITMHLTCYNTRKDIQAVVHAHSPFAMAYSLCGNDCDINIPEAVVSIGERIPVTKFALPGSTENQKYIEQVLSESNVFLMPGNGIISVGDSLEQAYLRLELAEHVLKISYYTKMIGTPLTLTHIEKTSLSQKRKSAGLCASTKTITPSSLTVQDKVTNNDDPLKKLIAEEIKKLLGQT